MREKGNIYRRRKITKLYYNELYKWGRIWNKSQSYNCKKNKKCVLTVLEAW